MSRKAARPALLLPAEVVMDLQVKLFRLHTEGTYLFMIARGLMGIAGITALFHEVDKSTQSLLYCKVLIDLNDTKVRLDLAEVNAFTAGLKHDPWASGNRVALIVPPHLPDMSALVQLRTDLAQRGLKIAVFTTTKSAVDWLSCKN
jgi:hypothetical protein